MEQEEKRRIIEALLFAAEKPLTVSQIKEVLEDAPVQAIKDEIACLRSEYADSGRSFNIIEVAGGYQIVTDAQYAPWLKKLYRRSRKEKLSQPSLETLAIISYRQPITRIEIENIRGVNVEGILKTLLEKSLIRISGHKDIAGRPFLYSTSRYFLEFFGLQSLAGLPKLEEFGDVGSSLPESPELNASAVEDSSGNPGGEEDGVGMEEVRIKENIGGQEDGKIEEVAQENRPD